LSHNAALLATINIIIYFTSLSWCWAFLDVDEEFQFLATKALVSEIPEQFTTAFKDGIFKQTK